MQRPEAIRLRWNCWSCTANQRTKIGFVSLTRKLLRLPEQEKELLATLAVAEAPVQWDVLAEGVGWNGTPPENLLRHGLLLELEEGMWLHEALRERLRRDVGLMNEERKKRLA